MKTLEEVKVMLMLLEEVSNVLTLNKQEQEIMFEELVLALDLFNGVKNAIDLYDLWQNNNRVFLENWFGEWTYCLRIYAKPEFKDVCNNLANKLDKFNCTY